MEFGKVNRIGSTSLSLPPLEKRSVHCLESFNSNPAEKPKVYVGGPVWSKKEWVGKVYPRKAVSRDYLKYYSMQFNAVELNASFYRIPDQATISNWKKTVPNGFKFCPKFHQDISHRFQLGTAGRMSEEFCESIAHLENTLGLCFLQLPPHWDKRLLPQFRKWIKSVSGRVPIAVEFRHDSWFAGNSLIDSVFDILGENRCAAVITDVVGRRDVLHGSLPSRQTMIRFLGNQLDSTDFLRIDQWVLRLGEWFRSGLKEVYFFVHQPNEDTVPELTRYFVEKMNAKYQLSIKDWVSPELLSSDQCSQIELALGL